MSHQVNDLDQLNRFLRLQTKTLEDEPLYVNGRGSISLIDTDVEEDNSMSTDGIELNVDSFSENSQNKLKSTTENTKNKKNEKTTQNSKTTEESLTNSPNDSQDSQVTTPASPLNQPN